MIAVAEDLFGNDVPDTSVPAGRARPVTNDMTAVMTVLGRAEDEFGYVLAGLPARCFAGAAGTGCVRFHAGRPPWSTS